MRNLLVCLLVLIPSQIFPRELDSELLLKYMGNHKSTREKIESYCVWERFLRQDRIQHEDEEQEMDPSFSGTEVLFGTGNVEGVTGNGSMGAGFAPEGELTLLKWPSPSYYDQVSYLTPFLLYEDTGRLRSSAYNGAAENDGSFAGLYCRSATWEGCTWFRSREMDDGRVDSNPCDAWVHELSYYSDSSAVLVATAINKQLGLKVQCFNIALPNDPSPFNRNSNRGSVLVRHYKIFKDRASNLEDVRFIYYENLAPCNKKLPSLPIRDVYLDDLNDFAALYHSRERAIIHFRPESPDLHKLLRQAHTTQRQINRLIERLDCLFPNACPFKEDGVFLAVGGVVNGVDNSSEKHQVGLEKQINKSFSHPQDGYYDAKDGRLSNSSFAASFTSGASGALSWELEFSEEGLAEVTIFISADFTARGARELLAHARSIPWEQHLEQAEEWWAEFMGQVKLPSPDFSEPWVNRKIRAVAARAIINIMLGYDKVSGAIVASLNTQSPYGEDWPRDGTFFNLALDIAGLTDMVTKRNLEFYARIQRNNGECYWWWPGMTSPVDLAGTYEMNYYADGMSGGVIFFEIDNAGLLAWSMWDHYRFMKERDGKFSMSAREYLLEIFPALSRTVQTLALCRDAETGLQCTAFEDDNPVPSQTLHGAITTYMALDAGIQAAEELELLGGNVNTEHIDFWRQRKDELYEAILGHFYNESLGHFGGGSGAGAWLIYPACLLPYEDPRMISHAQYVFDCIAPGLNMDRNGSSYDAKATVALAHIGWEGEASAYPGFNLREAQKILMTQVPVPGTLGYGEVYVCLDSDGDGVRDTFDNRTTIPHIWNGTLQYITAMNLWGNQVGEE